MFHSQMVKSSPIVHHDGVYFFTRQQNLQGRSTFGARLGALDALDKERPGTVFDTDFRWQLVPTKLYKYEDRQLYLRQKYPLVHPNSIGVDQYCWIILVRQNQIVLVQAEACRVDADAVFHVAAMLGHFGLDRDSTPIYTGGMIGEEGQLYRQLKIYFDIRNLDDELAAGPHTAPIELLLAHQKALREQPIPL